MPIPYIRAPYCSSFLRVLIWTCLIFLYVDSLSRVRVIALISPKMILHPPGVKPERPRFPFPLVFFFFFFFFVFFPFPSTAVCRAYLLDAHSTSFPHLASLLRGSKLGPRPPPMCASIALYKRWSFPPQNPRVSLQYKCGSSLELLPIPSVYYYNPVVPNLPKTNDEANSPLLSTYRGSRYALPSTLPSSQTDSLSSNLHLSEINFSSPRITSFFSPFLPFPLY